MAYTNVETVGAALAALNGARRALRPEFCKITRGQRAVYVQKTSYGTKEVWGALSVTVRAARTINAALKEYPNFWVIDDQNGDWIGVLAIQ